MKQKWEVQYHHKFAEEYFQLDETVQNEISIMVELLKEFGPLLRRPKSDTLEGSNYSNMKELRFNAKGGVWRVAFAFDPKRQAILLVAGDKKGANQKLFYKQLIKKADTRFEEWLAALY